MNISDNITYLIKREQSQWTGRLHLVPLSTDTRLGRKINSSQVTGYDYTLLLTVIVGAPATVHGEF